jgi:hypothetical protein
MLVLVGLALAWPIATRLAMARTELWLDEIWSWQWSRTVVSPAQVFTGIHLDNNHYLVTLWMFLVGDRRDALLYRLPALVAGIGTVPLLWMISSRRSRVGGVIAAMLGGTSYLLAIYSSEARGYVPAVFFSLVCLDQMQRWFEKPAGARRVVFALSAAVGLCWHLTFVYPYAGIVCWQTAVLWKRRQPWRSIVRELLPWHLPAATLLVALYWIDLRHLQIAGGAPYPLGRTFSEICGFTLGLAPTWPGSIAIIALVVVPVVCLVEVVALWRARDPMLALYFGGLVVPFLSIAVWRPATLYPRYLLTCVPLLLLLLSGLVSRGIAAGGWKRPVTALALVLVAEGNMRQTLDFFPNARGQYVRALRGIQSEAGGSVVTLGSEYDFRVQALLQYYAPLLSPTPVVDFITGDKWLVKPPDWVIFDSIDPTSTPKPRIVLKNHVVYGLVRDYERATFLSGFDWYVYRRTGAR